MPDYRKNVGSNLIYSGLNGPFQITNITLPNKYLSKQIRAVVPQTPFITSIRGIKQLLEEDGKIAMDLTVPLCNLWWYT